MQRVTRRPLANALPLAAAFGLILALDREASSFTEGFSHLLYAPIIWTSLVWGRVAGFGAGVAVGLLVTLWDPAPSDLWGAVGSLARLAGFVACGWLAGLNMERLREQTELNWRLMSQTVQAGIHTVDAIHPPTSEHSRRVSAISLRIGEQLKLKPSDLRVLRLGSLIHDIGKVAIPREILDKPGRLTGRELEIVQTHSAVGDRILSAYTDPTSVRIRDIVRHHHERLDGSGYPDGLAHSDWSLLAQIVAVADAYDGLTTPRPDRSPVTPAEAMNKLRREADQGRFDPSIVVALGITVGAEQVSERPPALTQAVPTRLGGWVDRARRLLTSPAAADLFLLFLISVAVLAIQLRFDMAESLFVFVAAHEHWELDELFVWFPVAIIAVAIFTVRRVLDLQAERTARQAAERLLSEARVDLDAARKRDQRRTELEYMAFHDPLTQLPNRRLFETRSREAGSWGISYGVLFLDLDNFKTINDQYGHEIGDQLLVEVAERMQEEIRATDTLARLGGDEFALLLVNVETADARRIAQRLLDRLSEPIVCSGIPLNVTCSIGVALGEGDDIAELYRVADLEMYRAKRGGKAQFSLVTTRSG